MYLIFSANKSREFFGYARMESEIEDRATMGHVKAEGVSGRLAVWDPSVVLTGPKVKTTPRTKNGPRGKIFEDEVRGTVFWEVAESSGDDEDDVNQYQPKVADTLGNTFQIEWVKWFSLFVLEPDGREVPVRFERTRLLRNPWNGNREVKISRDGTEIEPSVGARLLKEFDVELSTIGPGSRPVVRHMSYQMPPDRPTMSRPLVYQWFPPAQAAPHLLYGTVVGTPATTFNYASHQGMPQHSLRQPYGSKGQRYRIPKLANVAEGHYLF